MNFTKSKKYDKTFLEKNMMGPNCLKLLEALTEGINFPEGGRVLDLGCGKGLTSIFLAKEFGLKVFATDLWIPASDNYRRFKEAGFEDSIIPVHAEAHELPYAEEYFDAAISVDAYHYFGRDDEYMDEHFAPLVKKGGVLAMTVPGLVREYDSVPGELRPFLSATDFDTLHSRGWWKSLLSRSKLFQLNTVTEYMCDEAWHDWFLCDNEHAANDIRMFENGGGKYLNFISIIGHRV
jgi:cyclopropane fatty-acyl-phospholipid synthase-like methyltransferase